MNKLAILGVGLAFLLMLPLAQADTTAITLTSYGDYTNGAWTLGFEFSPTTDIDVTSLGSFFPTGATDTHGVTIWDSTETVLATTTVKGNGTEGFDYTAITPLELLAGDTYVIGATTLSDDYADEYATWTTAADIDYIGHVEIPCAGVAPCYPTSYYAGTDFGDFGANFTFVAVPEPASIALLGSVLLVLGTCFRRKIASR